MALSDPDVEWHSLFAFGERGGVYRGHEGTRQFMTDLDEVWEVGYAEVDDMLGCGDVAVGVGRIRYRGRGSGVEAATDVGWTLLFREGRLRRFQAFREPEQVLADVGR